MPLNRCKIQKLLASSLGIIGRMTTDQSEHQIHGDAHVHIIRSSSSPRATAAIALVVILLELLGLVTDGPG